MFGRFSHTLYVGPRVPHESPPEAEIHPPPSLDHLPAHPFPRGELCKLKGIFNARVGGVVINFALVGVQIRFDIK